MKKYFLYIVLGGLLASSLTACQQDVPSVEQTDEMSRRIYLSAGIGNSESTRAPYYPTNSNGAALTAPTLEHPLNVSVWASTESGVYPNSELNGSEGTVAIHTDAHFQSGDPQLLGEAIYPKAQGQDGTYESVYFVGLHPLSSQTNSWTATNDNKNAQFTFTGKEDVMFAPQISGTYNTAFDQSPQFHFYHLLTWLRISMVADKDETEVLNREKVRDAWGKIKSLSLVNTKNVVTINNLGTATKNNVTFTPEESNVTMSLYSAGTDDVFATPGDANSYKSIPTSQTEMAYVMCAPVEGETQDALGNPVPEYTLHIVTEHREMDIPLDLKGDDGNLFVGNTMGRMFNIVLNFKMGDVISVSTEISVGGDADWFTHGTGTGDLTEGDLKSNAGNN